MAKDYKDRGEQRRRKGSSKGPAEKPGRWILIGTLIISFIAFLVYLKSTAPTKQEDSQALVSKSATKAEVEQSPEPPKKVIKAAPPEPNFDFYEILPNAEAIVSEHEIKTRIREELVGRGKSTIYTLQAGAFQNIAEAEQLKGKLAFLAVASKIEKARVGGAIWYRVKLGPYDKLAQVDAIKSKLRKNGLDPVITEKPQ